ncbi:DNA repair protein RecN [Micrococcales bacterium 31B]|nr:DNA repair protein RecN [Micrococcales bacterium 31B]
MISELRIKGVGLIEDTTLEFAPGFTALTGETGSGKTMIVTGLGLLLGARRDRGKRDDLAAHIEGRFTLAEGHALRTRLDELGADLDDDELLLVRRITREGKSRSHVGGTSVPLATLAECGGALVTIHGQSDQMRLKSVAHQRFALDSFCGRATLALAGSVRSAFADLTALRREVADLEAHLEQRRDRAARLGALLVDVHETQPLPGEDEDLRREDERLANIDDVRRGLDVVQVALDGDGRGEHGGGDAGAVAQLRAAVRGLEGLGAETLASVSPDLATLVARLESLSVEVEDAAADLARAAGALDADPYRHAEVQERRSTLTALVKRVRAEAPEVVHVDSLLTWAEASALEVVDLDGTEDRIRDLHEQITAAEQRLGDLAGQLSAERARGASALADAVDGELGQLNMPGAHFEVSLEPLDEVAAHGADRVEFMLRPHPGAPLNPLALGASGGELSRVMLALEVALMGREEPDSLPTFIFDEIDAGVGGEAALNIGRRLAALARSAQVIVVTHLAQVAAFADQHLTVSKRIEGREGEQMTVSEVGVVESSQRRVELARMLSGVAESEAALTHADELLALGAGADSAP